MLLLDHGADPAKSVCSASAPTAMMTAIYVEDLIIIDQYNRSGIDINFSHGNVLPFEASVLHGNINAAEMLFISGCSCGVFSLDNHHRFKDDLKPKVEKLMKDWKVQENNVPPLKHRCRNVILKQLSPRADKNIGKLQLPGCLVKFLDSNRCHHSNGKKTLIGKKEKVNALRLYSKQYHICLCLPYSGTVCKLVSSEGGWVVDSSFCGARVLLSIVGVGRSPKLKPGSPSSLMP